MANDTPNFIGNRLIFIPMAKTIEYAIDEGLTVPEVDMLTGPLVGRPKTGTYRMADLVGVDIVAHIASNLYDLPPCARLFLLRRGCPRFQTDQLPK